MHHSMQQRVDRLAVLRARSLIATAEFYELIGRPAPAPALLQAVAKGKAWHIVEIATRQDQRLLLQSPCGHTFSKCNGGMCIKQTQRPVISVQRSLTDTLLRIPRVILLFAECPFSGESPEFLSRRRRDQTLP